LIIYSHGQEIDIDFKNYSDLFLIGGLHEGRFNNDKLPAENFPTTTLLDCYLKGYAQGQYIAAVKAAKSFANIQTAF
jgi:hypothetical protein